MNKKIIILLIITASNLAYTAALNQPNLQQKQHRYIGINNRTNEAFEIDSEIIPAMRKHYIEVPAGTTIADILARIKMGKRKVHTVPPIAINTPLQNDIMITFIDKPDPEIIYFRVTNH